jgi:flagellar biogenesis protein FliO
MVAMRRFATAVVFGLLLCGAVCAAEPFDETRPIRASGLGKSARTGDKAIATGKVQERNSSSSWWTTLVSLTAVLALVYLTAKVLRKGIPAPQRTLPIEAVQVIGRKSLDYKNTIQLVRCGSRLLILGSSQAGLTALSEITDPAEVDYLTGLCKPSEPATVAETFNQLFRKFQAPQTSETTGETELETEPGPDLALPRLQACMAQPGGIGLDNEDRFEEVAV